MAIDYSTEYLYWDNPEPVTVTIKSPDPLSPGSPSLYAIQVEIAFREDLDRESSMRLDVQSTEDITVWNIPSALLQRSSVRQELREGDTILDGEGVTWLVVRTTEMRIGSSRLHWVATCTKQRG